MTVSQDDALHSAACRLYEQLAAKGVACGGADPTSHLVNIIKAAWLNPPSPMELLPADAIRTAMWRMYDHGCSGRRLEARAEVDSLFTLI